MHSANKGSILVIVYISIHFQVIYLQFLSNRELALDNRLQNKYIGIALIFMYLFKMLIFSSLQMQLLLFYWV